MRTLCLLILPCAAMLMTACTPAGLSIGIGGGSRNFGIGTALSFPIGMRANTELKADEGHVIAFFDAGFNTRLAPSKGGYYRELLTQHRSGLYLVQDFYQDSRKKRTDPMLVEKRQLTTFHAHPANGSRSVYYKVAALPARANTRTARPAAASRGRIADSFLLCNLSTFQAARIRPRQNPARAAPGLRLVSGCLKRLYMLNCTPLMPAAFRQPEPFREHASWQAIPLDKFLP